MTTVSEKTAPIHLLMRKYVAHLINVSEYARRTGLWIHTADTGCSWLMFSKLLMYCSTSLHLRFFYKLRINNKQYPVGKGKSIKEAKQSAARQAWFVLQEQSSKVLIFLSLLCLIRYSWLKVPTDNLFFTSN